MVTERLLIEFCGNWYYKIFGRIVLRNKLIFLLGSTKIFWEICFAMGGDRQTVLNFAGTGTTKFSGGLF